MRGAPVHTIILPHFTWKSITFWLSVMMLVMFLSLVGVYASREKSDIAWSCLMFQTQNKFYPRLRYNYEFWRILVSSLFHGNISHVVLNLLGMQLYGYFCEWYFGKLRFALMLVIAIVNSHLLSCLTNVVSVSSTASGLLYTFLGLKIIFFVKYRSYKPLDNRRAPLYSLFGLIFAMNLVVLFVGSNVDVGGHVGNESYNLGGFVTGLLFGGMFYHDDPKAKKEKALKYSMMALAIVLPLALLGACFGLNSPFYTDLNSAIDVLC